MSLGGGVGADLDVVVEEVVEALLEAVEDQMNGTHAELDQLAEEPNVLWGEMTQA